MISLFQTTTDARGAHSTRWLADTDPGGERDALDQVMERDPETDGWYTTHTVRLNGDEAFVQLPDSGGGPVHTFFTAQLPALRGVPDPALLALHLARTFLGATNLHLGSTGGLFGCLPEFAEEGGRTRLPDYAQDLNAQAQLLARLNGRQADLFRLLLLRRAAQTPGTPAWLPRAGHVALALLDLSGCDPVL